MSVHVDELEHSAVSPPAPTRPAPTPGRRRPVGTRVRLFARRYLRSPVVFVHRWTSLVLGIVLLLVTTSGAAIVFMPELTRALHPDFYAVAPATGTGTGTGTVISPDAALAAVRAQAPGYTPDYLNLSHGVYAISSAKDPREWGVDATTGVVTAHVDLQDGVLGFLENAHECFFSCEDYPGYLAVLADPAPGAGTILPEGATWATAVLEAMGFLLLLLCVSGIVIWWPRLARLREAFTVRWKKGRYARDFDLHKVIGLIAIPFLLMWAITGINFELPLSSLWYSVTGGTTPKTVEFSSAKSSETTDITGAAAVAAALQRYPGATLAGLSYPDAKDSTSYFDVWVGTANDTWKYGLYPGEKEVAVDRHDASRSAELTVPSTTLSNQLWDEWSVPIGHYGVAVNGWWRIIWFVFGMSPLALAITGVSTWLYKRGVARRKAQRTRERLAERTPAPEPELVDA